MSKTIEVAERIMVSAQRDMWALADAVLADVPDAGLGGDRMKQNPGTGVLVGDQLSALAVTLDRQGIVKPDGTPYQPGYLFDLREVAMAWPVDERQAETSFNTHREFSGPDARVVMKALCAHARGEKVSRPEQCEPRDWKAALDKIATRRRGWMVQTEAVRVALKRAPKNAPTRLDAATFTELLRHLTIGLEGLQAFADQITKYEMDTEDRVAMLRVLHRLRDRAVMTIDVLSASVDDDDLDRLLDEERSR